MKDNFFIKQSEENKELYVDLLETTGSLSNLFSESKKPFLYYRAMENIFCKSFSASNLSRSDISVDAGKDGIGIGLKTFLQENGNTFQKIAEFNKESYLFKGLSGLELAKKVSSMRNKRIESTKKICNLSDVIYHLVTRSKEHMAIFEEHMDFVDIDNIVLIGDKSKRTTLHFTDGLHEYSFNLSKSTLMKRFDTSNNKKIYGFGVKILDNPYDLLLSIRRNGIRSNVSQVIEKDEGISDYIILPLYSTRNNKVPESSGLNQWNAKGRDRDENEVYIPIPSWIHKKKRGFFKYNTDDNKTGSFDVKLPNGEVFSMKVAQQGGKALMSNPNSKLGKWILRDILELGSKELVTKETLDIIGIDSVKLSKMEDGSYSLDFLKSGSFEKFFKEFNN